MKASRLFFLIILIFPGCMQQLQQQIDHQQRTIADLQKTTQSMNKSLSRYQADYSNELDKLKREIQNIRGITEEATHNTDQDLIQMEGRVEELIASIRENEEQIELLRNKAGPDPDTVPQPGPVPPQQVSDEQNRYDRAYDLFNNGNYENSRKLFDDFLTTYPDSSLADNALFWMGNCFFKEKKYKKAISFFDDVIKKFPKGNKAPDAHYLQALAFSELNEPLTAQIILETLIQEFPETQAAAWGKKKHEELTGKSVP